MKERGKNRALNIHQQKAYEIRRFGSPRLTAGLIKKDSGGKEIIAEVGLAVIAVALIILFRNQISDIMTDLMEATKNNISDLFSMS